MRKPVKLWLVLLCDTTMPLYLVGSTEILSPTSRSRTAEPDVTKKPSAPSHSVKCSLLPFISFRHTYKVKS